MRLISLFLLFLGCTFFAITIHAGEVVLTPGESIRLGETDVVCRDNAPAEPIRLNECQIWDAYEKRCLHERSTYSMGNLVCVEECQHWDDYSKTCFFSTTCTYYPSQAAFVRTICSKFDQYNKKCQESTEEKLSLLGP